MGLTEIRAIFHSLFHYFHVFFAVLLRMVFHATRSYREFWANGWALMELLYATLRTRGMDGTPLRLSQRLTTTHIHAWQRKRRRTQRWGGTRRALQEWTQEVWLPMVEVEWKAADARDKTTAVRPTSETMTATTTESQPVCHS